MLFLIVHSILSLLFIAVLFVLLFDFKYFTDLYFLHFSLFFRVFEDLKKPKYSSIRNKCLVFDIYIYIHTYIYIYIYIYICIYIYIYFDFDKKFTNLWKHFLTLDFNFWHCFDIHFLFCLLVTDWKKGVQNRWSGSVQKSRDNKKDLYNDQTYESINNVIPYSISLHVINKNAIIFYQKNLPKHPPSAMNWSSFMSMHSRLPTSITNYLVI